MHTLTHQSQRSPGRLTVLAIAVASTMATALPAVADPMISTPLSTSQNWTSGDFTITSTGSISNSNFAAVNASGASLGTLSNSGQITSAYEEGIYSTGGVNTISNSGTITAGDAGIWIDSGTTGTIRNSGLVTGGVGVCVEDGGQLGQLINTETGVISGDFGIGNFGSAGAIAAISNAGVITGSVYAIYNSAATIGTITNSGTIAGTIQNSVAQDLTFNGGTGSTFGVLTGNASGYGMGADNIGQITSSGNLIFGSGNQLLNDNINVSGFGVSNQGTLQVNNSIAITGNYDQAANAQLLIGVGNAAVTTGAITDSGYGRLVVSGAATIASGSSVELVSTQAYGFAQGQRYLVIQANGTGTNYNAGTLHYSAAGYTVAGATVVGTSVVDGSNKDLLVTLGYVAPPVVVPPVVTPPVTPPVITPVTPPETPPVITPSGPINRATTSNAVSTINGLFNYQGYDANLMNVYNAAAALGSSPAGNKAGAQLSPTSNLAASTNSSVASTVQVLNIASAHVDGLRTAQNGSTASGIATGESGPTSGLWGQAFGGTARMDESDEIAGYHARYNGLLIGADGMVNDSWRAGGLFSYTKTTVNNDGDNDGSSADVKSYGLFGYASYTANPWYLDLSAGAVQHQYDTEREVDFTGVNGTAKGSHNGMQYTASAQAGYPIDLGTSMANVILTPIAGLSYSTLRQDSYTEKGGDGTALHVDANTLDSLKSDLGTKLERSFATQYGSLTPSAQLTWRHEYRDSALQSVANFSADTSGATSFSSTGPKAVEDTGVLTVGLTLLTHNNLTVAAHYTGETGGGFNANTGDLQVRWMF